MGSTWSLTRFMSSSPPSTSQLQIKDVLALCEDGDILLVREKLADSALRVGVEFIVARDIQSLQRGQFPAQRVTTLPPWTSCELLLRHEGVLHVVSVGANGLQVVPFEERVASKMPHIHDRFAIRRLRHDARSEFLSTALRELAIHIASVAPISWQTLLCPTTTMKMSPRSPRQQFVNREAVIDALKDLPPVIWRLMKRVMELFFQGLKINNQQTAEALSANSHRDDKNIETSIAKNESVGAEFRGALEVLGVAEVTARLSAAFVAAVYEYVHLLEPITAIRSDPLLPATFWSSCSDNERLVLTPPTALGSEMTLTRPTQLLPQQNTYSLAK